MNYQSKSPFLTQMADRESVSSQTNAPTIPVINQLLSYLISAECNKVKFFSDYSQT